MKNLLIASSHPDAGLCNKLKSLITVLRLSKYLNKQPLLHWNPTVSCRCLFSEIFQPIENLPIVNKMNAVRCNSWEDIQNNINKDILINDWRFILLPIDVKKGFTRVFPRKDGEESIDLEYERIPKKLREEILKYVSFLVPIKKIRERISSFLKENNNFENVVGIHARRTQFLLNTDGRGKVSTDDAFFERMSEIIRKNPTVKFFLATDSQETLFNFIKRFGTRIIYQPNVEFDVSKKESVFDALTDLFILSETQLILGTFLSTFTEIAWWFSGCKAKVEIVGNRHLMKEVVNKNLNPPKGIKQLILKPIKWVFRIFRRMFPSLGDKITKMMVKK